MGLMTMDNLYLYIGDKTYSSWSMRPWLALQASGLAFTEEMVWLDTPQTPGWLAANSPNAKVPLLRHGDLLLAESIAIIEYIAELAPDAGLWPRDRQARALARAASAEMHAGFGAVRKFYPMHLRKRFPGFQVPEDMRAAVAEQVARIEALWADCRARFGADGPFLFGGFGAADCMFAPVVTRFVTYDVPLMPSSRAYVAAMLAQPHVRAWVAGAQQEQTAPRWDEPTGAYVAFPVD